MNRLCLLLLFTPACFFIDRSHQTPPPETRGDLGAASFRFECADPEETTCTTQPQFPVLIARGADFGLSTSGVLRSASTRLSISGSTVHAEAEGIAGLYVQSRASSVVVDFIHVEIVAIASLELVRDGDTARLVLLDKDGRRLAGTIDAEWNVEGDRMHAAIGTTDITATYDGLSATLGVKR